MMENSSENERFLKVKNLPKRCKGHRFHGFSVFRKNRKMEPKGYPKVMKMEPKSVPGGPGSIVPPLWAVLGRVEKSSFFDVAPWRQKINKNQSKLDLGLQRLLLDLQGFILEAQGPILEVKTSFAAPQEAHFLYFSRHV